jgi:hypothetical protein
VRPFRSPASQITSQKAGAGKALERRGKKLERRSALRVNVRNNFFTQLTGNLPWRKGGRGERDSIEREDKNCINSSLVWEEEDPAEREGKV